MMTQSRGAWSYLIVLVIGMIILWKLCATYTLADVRDRQQRLQDVQLAELDRQLNQYSYVPKLLSEDVEIRNALVLAEEPSLLAANRRLQRTQQDSGLDVAFLLDADGMTVASSNWADTVSFVGVSYSFRPYFKEAVQGSSASFFAVGATTGIPGYFLAEPVSKDNTVLGVVVVKIALDVLVDAWSQLPYESLVIDDLGGVILSTRKDLLHTPMLPLTEEQFKQLERDRRYTLQPARVVAYEPESQTRVIRNDIGESTYLMFSQSLVTEPWQLLALVAQRSIHQQTTLLLAAIVSVALIGFLCLRVFQQQRQLVQSEQRNSQSLEEQVARRTRELELAQQRLISESNFAMLGRMSAAINHEINQPLASLRLNLASLRTMIELPEADQDEISQIVVDSDRTTKRIARVISSLRSLVRKSDLQFHVVDLEKVVRDVFDTVQRERTVASKYLHLDIRGGDYKIMGDEVLIQQALLNLLYNAFDAVIMADAPEVNVTLGVHDTPGIPANTKRLAQQQQSERPTPNIFISVKDNGDGVSDSIAETLFEPFSTTRGQHDGLGLGLTIARQIAVDHGGDLAFRALQAGSCFTLMFPTIPTVNASTDKQP